MLVVFVKYIRDMGYFCYVSSVVAILKRQKDQGTMGKSVFGRGRIVIPETQRIYISRRWPQMEPLIRRHCTLDWNRPERFSAGFIGREIETIPTSITTVEFRSFSMETIGVTRLVAVIHSVFILGPGLKRWYELCPTKIQVSNNWYSLFFLSFFFSLTLSILLYLLFAYSSLFFFDRTEKQYNMREKVPPLLRFTLCWSFLSLQ